MGGDDDNVFDRFVVADSPLRVVDLVSPEEIAALFPKTGCAVVDLLIDTGAVWRWLTQPHDPRFALEAELRRSVRELAHVIALRRLALGLDCRNRPASYPARERRLAAETLRASSTMRHDPIAATA